MTFLAACLSPNGLHKYLTMKYTVLIITLFAFSFLEVKAQALNDSSKQNTPDTGRITRAQKKYQQLFGAQSVLNSSDPDLMNILQRFIFGEVFYLGNLDDKTRELITITALTTNQTLPQLKVHTT